MPIRPLDLNTLESRLPLHDSRASRQIEADGLSRLPPHTLMNRAGEAVYRLSAALAPHARQVWIVCGGGNNGGDGLIAAIHWWRQMQKTGGQISVTWLGQEDRLPADAAYALRAARAADVPLHSEPPPSFDLAIDAIVGIGLSDALRGPGNDWVERLQSTDATVLAVDLPSGLDADTGQWHSTATCRPSAQRHTLQLLTLKPGPFTAMGRTASGQIWFDDLGIAPPPSPPLPSAWLNGFASHPDGTRRLAHHQHKGSHGDVWIAGGSTDPTGLSMMGAALLAARASLKSGAGRVYVSLLGPLDQPPSLSVDPWMPELMFRSVQQALQAPWLSEAVAVCGCGGGTLIGTVLPPILERCPRLVLDADALNAIAADPLLQEAVRQRAARGQVTVTTPHPKEAARLLGQSVEAVQANRLTWAQTLAERLACTVVLKGSGTVLTMPGERPLINPTGNGLLATAGTGDVLAGMIGAALASQNGPVLEAVAQAVYRHGQLANSWPNQRHRMTASDLLAGM